MFGIGIVELVVVLAVVLCVFGWGRVPQLGDNIRQTIRNFQLMAREGGEIDITPTAPDKRSRKDLYDGR
jgi:sec-independent protein translocase protein TatA